MGKHCIVAFITLAVWSVSAQAQSATSTATADWQALTALLQPRTAALALNPSDSAAISASDAEISRLKSASAAAHTYAANYPTDKHTADAKRIEITALLEAAQLGAQDVAPSAVSGGTAFRADHTNPVHDRFEVAVAMQALSFSAANPHTRVIDSGAAYQSAVDALHTEFGDIPEVFAKYLELIRTADSATATQVAQQLQAMNAPAAIKAEASQVAGRAALMGAAIDFSKLVSGAKAADLQNPIGPTIVYFWNAGAGYSDLDILARFRTTLPSGSRLVYVGLGGTAVTAPDTAAHIPAPGPEYFDAKYFSGALATYLHVRETPYVFVLNRSGTLSGFGRVENLPALLRSAAN